MRGRLSAPLMGVASGGHLGLKAGQVLGELLLAGGVAQHG